MTNKTPAVPTIAKSTTFAVTCDCEDAPKVAGQGDTFTDRAKAESQAREWRANHRSWQKVFITTTTVEEVA